MSRRPSLFHLAYESLRDQLRPGHSKHKVKQEALRKAREIGLSGRERWRMMNAAVFEYGIFSYKTFETYIKVAREFTTWIKEVKGIKRADSLDEIKQYAREYLLYRKEQALSAWTLKLDRAALAKIFRDNRFLADVELPKRRIENVKRSRYVTAGDRRFDPAKNRDLVDFARATGLRRRELSKVTVRDVREENGRLYVHVERGKGGKSRDVRVRGDLADRLREIVAAAEREGRDRLFDAVPQYADIHFYRREYAKARLEEEKARGVDEARAMREVSQDLGHKRLDVLRFYTK